MLSSLADFRRFKNGSLSVMSAFLLMGLLGGCQTPPAPRSLPHRPAEAAYVPASATIALSDGRRAPVRLYPATVPQRGIILAFHGFGDSRDAWEVMAPALNRAGFLIVAPDVRGFGEFPAKGGWSTTDRMVADAVEEARWCQQRWPGQPLHLMGESMGGALALLTSTSLSTPRPDGLILLAPAIMTIGEPWQTLLEGWNLITPQARLTGAHMPGHHVATANLRAMRRMFFDPLTRHGTNVHALRGLTHLMARALEQAPSVQIPTLLVWGDRDQFVPASATRRLIRQAPPSLFRLDELPRGYHLITREPQDRPARDIISWIERPDRFLPSGGDSAATMWLWLEQTR